VPVWEIAILGVALYWVASLITVPSVLLQRQGHPVAALSWLLALFALPPFGLAAWWMLGRTHLRRKRRKRRRASESLTMALREVRARTRSPVEVDSALNMLVRLPRSLQESVFPPSGGNRVGLLVGGAEAYPRWERVIRAARHHVHLLFYSWSRDEVGRAFVDLLAQKAREGVEVRAMYDAVGSPGVGKSFFRPLTEAGGKARPFFPLKFSGRPPLINFRNHRKLLIVDGRVAFLGGINLGSRFGAWHDLALELQGPAADQVQEVFADDWYFMTGENLADNAYYGRWEPHAECGTGAGGCMDGVSCALLASGPDHELNATRELVFLSINQAHERVWIMTPYFLPDSPFLASLRAAVYRGVDVRVLLPAHSDIPLVRRASRSFYRQLLEANIRIFEYQPNMMHAKAILLDEHLVMMGSANMDTRSFRLNFEVSCFMLSQAFNAHMAQLFLNDCRQSAEVRLPEVKRHAWGDRVLDAAANLLSPLL